MQANFIYGWGISSEITFIWKSLDLIDDKSTLIQVMVRCWQATSHHMSQCLPSSLSPYGITRPQWGCLWDTAEIKKNQTHSSSEESGDADKWALPQLFFFAKLISPWQNGHHFPHNSIRCIFVNEKVCILIKISVKFVDKCPIDNNPALV